MLVFVPLSVCLMWHLPVFVTVFVELELHHHDASMHATVVHCYQVLECESRHIPTLLLPV